MQKDLRIPIKHRDFTGAFCTSHFNCDAFYGGAIDRQVPTVKGHFLFARYLWRRRGNVSVSPMFFLLFLLSGNKLLTKQCLCVLTLEHCTPVLGIGWGGWGLTVGGGIAPTWPWLTALLLVSTVTVSGRDYLEF